MKNVIKLFGIIAFAIVIGLSFASCSNGTTSSNVPTPDGGGTIVTNNDGSATISGIQIKDGTSNYQDIIATNLPNYTGTKDFRYCLLKDYSFSPIGMVIPNSSVKVTNGKLNITLGIPKDEYLINLTATDGLTVNPSNVKFFNNGEEGLFCASNNEYSEWLYCFKKESYTYRAFAILIYADRDVTIKGTTGYGYKQYDCSLQKGWNYVINEYNYSTFTTTYKSSQELPPDFCWAIVKDSGGDGGGPGSNG